MSFDRYTRVAPPFVDYRMYLYMKDNPGRRDQVVRDAANIGAGRDV